MTTAKKQLKPDITSYTFKAVLKPDKWPDEPDTRAIWRAYIPALPAAHAWGDTPHEALERLRDAVDLIIADMLEQGEPIPTEPGSFVTQVHEPLITVAV
jgi:predicted RNase H-like HicB family nuclease